MLTIYEVALCNIIISYYINLDNPELYSIMHIII
ncbi:hypothetical protein, partial [Plasmodium yoelii yoelii]